MTTREAVLEELKTLTDPGSGKDIVSAGLVRALAVEGDTVRFVLEIDPKQATAMESVRAEAEARVRALPGVAKASVLMTAHSDKAPPDLKAAAQAETGGPAGGARRQAYR